MTNSIRELTERAKCDPDAKLDIPFDFKKANAIRTMLGAWSILRKDAVCFLLMNIDCGTSVIGCVSIFMECVILV